MSDTGWLSPSTMADDDTVGDAAWSNPDNAKTSDGSYATASSLSTYGDITDKVIKLVDESGSLVGDNNADTSTAYPGTDNYVSYGGSSDLWGNTWSYTDINNSNFGIVLQSTGVDADSEYLKATNFGFSIPTGSTIDGIETRIEKQQANPGLGIDAYIDHIQIKVYYTEGGATSAPFPMFFRP